MSREHLLRTIALHDVLEATDPAYHLRRVHRWYSMTFATPLHAVAELPEDEVLRHYYEHQYEQLRDEAALEGEAGHRGRAALNEERWRMSMTEDEFVEARREDEAEEVRVQDYLRREQERTDRDAPGTPGAGRAGAESSLPDEVPLNLPPDIEVQFPLDLERDALAGGMLDD